MTTIFSRAALAAVLASVAFSPVAGAGTVGDPSRAGSLGAELVDAYRRGDRDLTIAPGTYAIPAGDRDAIALDHWRDAVVHAPGVVLVFAVLGQGRRPVHFVHCENVAFEGATLRMAVPAATQGRVTAIGSDERGPYCDWTIDAGYPPDPNPVKSMLDVVDAHSRLLKPGTTDFSPFACKTIDAHCQRLWFHGKTPGFAVGDWLITRVEAGSVICHVDDSHGVVLRDLTMENGGFGTFFETNGGGNRYLHCRIAPAPRPAGASEDEIVSCGADGFHSVGTSVGPDIEDCEFRGVFHDDCIAIHGSFQTVVSAAGATLVIDRQGNQYSPGAPVRLSNANGFFAQATCSAVREIGRDGRAELTLDHPLDLPAGVKANNPDRCGKGYKILRCRLGDTRSRGILVKADDGLIDGCTIEGCGMSAISIGPEYYWGEADYCWNVTVSHNVIRACDKANNGNAPLLLHGDGAIGNRNIVIKDNLFDHDFGPDILKLEWADGIEISNNRIVAPDPLPVEGRPSVFRLEHIHGATFAGNVIEAPPPGAGATIALGKDVTGVVNDDAKGVETK